VTKQKFFKKKAQKIPMGTERAALPYHNRQQKNKKGKKMRTLGKIYGVILCVFNKKISVEDALEMIRTIILQDNETAQEHTTPYKNRKEA
jgi:hypothetical protein